MPERVCCISMATRAQELTSVRAPTHTHARSRTQKYINVTLYVHCVSCLIIMLHLDSVQVFTAGCMAENLLTDITYIKQHFNKLHLSSNCKYKVVQIWPGQTVTCLHTNRPGHIWTTLYITKIRLSYTVLEWSIGNILGNSMLTGISI
jgi:hypothetical protein